MRKHGWELPYHPLQVVAIAVFLALAFAFYVFFVPFVGAKVFQYSLVGLFSFLVTTAFSLYIWCAACDPADPAVSASKKYKKASQMRRISSFDDSISRPGSVHDMAPGMTDAQQQKESAVNTPSVEEPTEPVKANSCLRNLSSLFLLPCACFAERLMSMCAQNEPSEHHSCEEDILYCSLCKVEIAKHSKHCRVCDKCVDGFDHHCRWLNNCIGKANYKEFFALMIFALLLLILQWSIGIFVLVRCFLHRSQFDEEIITRLGSSFSLGPFVVVLGCCTLLAMIATLPLGQLFFFHILLINKGISTYDYIVAMREQEQQTVGDGTQSPQISHASSVSAFSASSSFTAFHLNHASWCTPPRLFVDDQYDVVLPEGAVPPTKGGNGNLTKKPVEQNVKKTKGTVKISPWALARMSAEEVSRVATQARKKSKVLQHVPRQEGMIGLETDSSLEGSSRDLGTEIKSLSYNPRRLYKHGKQPLSLKAPAFGRSSKLAKVSSEHTSKLYHTSNKNLINMNQKAMHPSAPLAPLQLEARNAFKSSLAMSTGGTIPSSAESSIASPDVQISRPSASGTQDMPMVPATPLSIAEDTKFERSASDGYDASAGESADDSDQNTAKLHEPWNRLLFNPTYLANKNGVKNAQQGTVYPSYSSGVFNSGVETRLDIESGTSKGAMTLAPSSSHEHGKEMVPSPSEEMLTERDTELSGVKITCIDGSPENGSPSVDVKHQ